MLEFRPDIVVDENNNEESGDGDQEESLVSVSSGSSSQQRMRLHLHRITVALIVCLALVPFGNGAVLDKAAKLRTIQSLTEGVKDAPWVKRLDCSTNQNPDICYDDGCLDAAFDLLHAANLSADPCVDYFSFACGRWVASNPVPPSSSRWSRFHRLRDEVNKITSTILNEGTDTDDPIPVNQVKEFYSKCIDLAELESTGLAPLQEVIQDFGGWPMLNSTPWDNSTFDWLLSLGEMRRRLLDDPMISIYIERDLKNTSRNVIFIDQPSFGLPRSILINASEYESLITAYRTYIVEVAQELGSTQTQANLEAAAQAIINLEIQLANVTKSDEDRYDMEAIYNPYTLREFRTYTDMLLPGYAVDWLKLLTQAFSSSGVTITETELLNIAGLPYFQSALQFFRDAPSLVVANYFGWRIASSTLGETTQAMRDIQFKFMQALTGAKEPELRTATCAGAANNNFGMAIGVKYIEAVFDSEAKGLVDELVANLRVSFKEMVTDAEWMEAPTKAEALAKADAIRSFMAFPEWLENKTAIEEYYDGLRLVIGPGAHYKSALEIALWASDKTFSKLRVPTSQDEWLTYPGVVNAFYSPQHNSITFPAGILQPPFFGKTRPKSQNYGGIGVVIGHEITHGFDTQGSQFDKDGNVENWWDDVTKERYLEKAQCVIDQYSNFYVPSVDMYVNGELTQGENIADNEGLRESFKAYRHYVDQIGQEEGRLPGLEFLTPNQLFFLGYANIWCESITDEGLINQILTDPHSPARFRVIGPLRNNIDFAEAYNCPVSDDGMNPPPEDKCTVW